MGLGYFPPKGLKGRKIVAWAALCRCSSTSRSRTQRSRGASSAWDHFGVPRSWMIVLTSDPDLVCTDAVETGRETGLGSRMIRLFVFTRRFGERSSSLCRRKQYA